MCVIFHVLSGSISIVSAARKSYLRSEILQTFTFPRSCFTNESVKRGLNSKLHNAFVASFSLYTSIYESHIRWPYIVIHNEFIYVLQLYLLEKNVKKQLIKKKKEITYFPYFFLHHQSLSNPHSPNS